MPDLACQVAVAGSHSLNYIYVDPGALHDARKPIDLQIQSKKTALTRPPGKTRSCFSHSQRCSSTPCFVAVGHFICMSHAFSPTSPGSERAGKSQAAGDTAEGRGEATRGENPRPQNQREDGTDVQW